MNSPSSPPSPENNSLSDPIYSSENSLGFQRNIPKFMSAFIIRDLWVSMPVFIIFLQAKGLNYLQIGSLEGFIGITIVLAEIPSGALADLIGFKKTTLIGLVLWAVGLITMGLSNVFGQFLVAYLIIGLGDAFLSGASSALFYESLKRIGKQDQLVRYNGYMGWFSAIMVIIASFLGGYLYQIDIRLPFIIHGVFILVSALIVMTMKEPLVNIAEKPSIMDNIAQIKSAYLYTKNHQSVRFLILFSTLIFIPLSLFVNVMEQPYLLSIGFAVTEIGFVFAFSRGVIGFFALFRDYFEKKFAEKGSFYGITLLYGVLFFLLSFLAGKWLLTLLMLLFFTRDYSRAIIDKYANDQIPSSQRATILSFLSFVNNLSYSFVAFFIGFMLSAQISLPFSILGRDSLSGLSITTLFFSVFSFCLILPILAKFYHNKKEKPEKLKNKG